jgi:hypothetical protein
MSSEFIQAIAGFFVHTHGQNLKYAYAETLIHLLHPVIETATAEVNHPMWSKAIALILQRASGMLAKPRYWSIGFSLFVVTLGVSPREVFMQNWQLCMDNIQSRFKVSQYESTKLTTGPSISSSCNGCFCSTTLDLPQPMYRVFDLHAKTSRSPDPIFPIYLQSQPTRSISRTIRCDSTLYYDPTSRLWRRLRD